MSTIYLFTGEEEFLLTQEIIRRKAQFAAKFGQDSVFDYGQNRDPAVVVSALQWGGLFASKKLIIIGGVPSDKISRNKHPIDNVRAVHAALTSLVEHESDSMVVCFAFKPDKRTAEYKRFKKHATIKTFDKLRKPALVKRIKQQWTTVMDEWDALSSAVIDEMISRGGKDMWYLYHSLEILGTWQSASGQPVGVDDVRQLMFVRTEADNFAFLDALFVDRDRALQCLVDSQQDDVAPMLFVGAVTRWLKLVIQMLVLYQQGKTTSSILAKEIGGAPFVFGKYMKFVPDLVGRDAAVFQLWDDVVALDYGIKTGKYSSDSFRVQLKSIVTRFHNV